MEKERLGKLRLQPDPVPPHPGARAEPEPLADLVVKLADLVARTKHRRAEIEPARSLLDPLEMPLEYRRPGKQILAGRGEARMLQVMVVRAERLDQRLGTDQQRIEHIEHGLPLV